ncbi:MAG: addiction module toxin RelE [Silvania sp.]|uniref:addiction module toxin RelE n=1 Tax=Silvania sp. TaxID=3016633 RepID=UPI003EE5DBEE
MEAIFIELPAFERYRAEYLSDGAYREFQNVLLANPTAGDVIRDSGGLRKIRFVDERRGKGKQRPGK